MAPFKKILSSEIARLVYGYLNDCGVDEQVSCQFLRQSPYLTECRELYDEGDAFNTDFKGLSLKEILQEYSFIHHTVDTKIQEVYSLERVNLETPRLSDKLCLLLNVPARPRSRTSSFLGSRVTGTDKHDIPLVSKENETELEIPENQDAMESSGSFGVPETPGNSLAWDKPNETVIDQETFLNKMELSRETEKPTKKPRTLSRSLSVNDLTTDKRKNKPKFFTPNSKRTEESSKEVVFQIFKNLSEDKEWPEKIAKSINEAREAEIPSLDDAINTIIEKTTADPSFNQIMEQTLNNFDLLEYLKPNSKEKKKTPASKVEPPTEIIECVSNIPSLIMPVTMDETIPSAQLCPYPEIRYDPLNCNILTGTVDAQGNCVFFANAPQTQKNIITLQPPLRRPITRHRPILPKKPIGADLNPVIVCTPLMPPPVVDKPKTKTGNKKPVVAEEVTQTVLPSLLATPAPVEPVVDGNKSGSVTPGRKSYIRALEFETPAKDAEKLSWDAKLRAQLSELEKTEKAEKMSPKKGKREKKVKKPPARKKKTVSPRVTRSRKIMISPSKNNVTAKRNTYAISHGSSSAFESSSENEETPTATTTTITTTTTTTIVPQLVEMTPAKEDETHQEETPFTKLLRENVADVNIDLSMIPTPMFPATPCIETATPIHAARNTDYSSGSSYYKPELTSPGSVFNEMQEDHVQDVTTPSGTNLVISPDQLKINDLVQEGKRILGRSSGKNMSLLKLHTIASCDTKIGGNIPIKENLRDELERKRKSTILKIKKNVPTKRKRTQKPQSVNKTVIPDETVKHPEENVKKRLSEEMCTEVRNEFPPFIDDGSFPTLNLVSKKKFFFVKEILKREEVTKHLQNFSSTSTHYIHMKPCIRKIFKTLFNWLKHPHQHELDVAKDEIHGFLQDFYKINAGIRYKKKASNLSSLYSEFKKSEEYSSDDGSSIDSSVGKKWTAKRKADNVSLPLKKRRDNNSEPTTDAQKILKHIDVDRFLSKVHGQEKR